MTIYTAGNLRVNPMQGLPNILNSVDKIDHLPDVVRNHLAGFGDNLGIIHLVTNEFNLPSSGPPN